MFRTSMLIISLCLVFGLCAEPVCAQTNLGRIVGVIQDRSGAPIPGAAIVVANKGTGWTRESLSAESGDYEIANLVARTYSVAAELAGFKRFIRSEIAWDAVRTVRVDILLELGEISDEVRVEARTPLRG